MNLIEIFQQKWAEIEKRPRSNNVNSFVAFSIETIDELQKDFERACSEADALKQSYVELRERQKSDVHDIRATSAERDSFKHIFEKALGELECGRSDDPDNTPIWQAIVAHEAENATLRQELNKKQTQLEKLTEIKAELEDEMSKEKQDREIAIEKLKKDTDEYKRIYASMVLCNKIESGVYLENSKLFGNTFFENPAGEASKSGESHHTEEKKQTREEMVKDLEKLRKKPSGMTEQEMHLQLLEEAADRSNPNNEEGFFKNLHDTSAPAFDPDDPYYAKTMARWTQYLDGHANKCHARLRAELDEANKLVEQLQQENEDLKEATQENEAKRK